MEAVALKSDYEIERGKPMPSKLHAVAQRRLTVAISVKYPDLEPLPELTILLPSGKGGTPDIAIYPKMEIDWEKDEVKVKEAPLGVIEIFSPTQGSLEIMERKPQYFALGVKSMWIVNLPFKTIYVYHNEHAFNTFTYEDMLEDKNLGITLPLSEIFS
jgi:hypothetical protein